MIVNLSELEYEISFYLPDGFFINHFMVWFVVRSNWFGVTQTLYFLETPIKQKRSLFESIRQAVGFEDNNNNPAYVFGEGTGHARSCSCRYTSFYAFTVLEFEQFVGIYPD
jgi:hypothetical protein